MVYSIQRNPEIETTAAASSKIRMSKVRVLFWDISVTRECG
jgi:hypothetical protein